MKFINTTKNSVNLSDINKIIPYLGQSVQEISSDEIKRSSLFQSICLSNRFKIVSINESERIEQNLLKLQSKTAYNPELAESNIKVLMKGHFAGFTGYAKANRNILYALARQGIELAIDPVQPVEVNIGQDRQLLSRFLTIPHPNSIVLHSAIPTFAQLTDAKYSILYTTVESTSIPDQFIQSCDLYDEIWTTSDFCKDVLTKYGLKKQCFVIPNSVDNRFYNENVKPHKFQPPLKQFKFISVFSWNYRKGFDVLLKAYLKTFKGSDPVSLLIVSNYRRDENGFRRYEVENEIKKYIAEFGGDNPPHIARSGMDIPENEMPRVYKACDAFVLPSRGEGFSLPCMEASLCGLPVIATNHSGHTMFLNQNNSFLLEIDGFEIIEKGKTHIHYWDGQLFPKLTSDHVINNLGGILRYVFENKEVAVKKNKELQELILSSYSCDIVAAIAKQRLENIWTQLLSC